MFAAYPHQQRNGLWKLLLPLLFAGLGCLVLYATFETSYDDARRDAVSQDDAGLTRMKPFLSSSNFEIGLWTRQRSSAGDNTMRRPDVLPLSSDEVAALKQQLEETRARAKVQELELAKLKGESLNPELPTSEVPSKLSVEESSVEATTSTVPQTTTQEPIPESLWRSPPENNDQELQEGITSTMETTKLGSATAPQTVAKGDNVIIVKTGGKQVTFQISKEESVPSATQQQSGSPNNLEELAPKSGPNVMPPGKLLPVLSSESASSLNDTIVQSAPSRSGVTLSQNSDTQITVKSGQHAITIEVKGSEDVAGQKAQPLASPNATDTSVKKLEGEDLHRPVAAVAPSAPKELPVLDTSLEALPPVAAPLQLSSSPSKQQDDTIARSLPDMTPSTHLIPSQSVSQAKPESAAGSPEVYDSVRTAQKESASFANLAIRAR